MNILNLIKTIGIILVFVCCLIATYTDVKYKIIPNKLTFSTMIIGLMLISTYYYLISYFNIMYYVSVVFVFVLSYIFWYFGVWAGGDVKLFTAISTLFVPEVLNIFENMGVPFFSINFSIPTLYLMLNSVFSIIPVIVIMITYIIIKSKHYLIKNLYETIDMMNALLVLNSLIMSYQIINMTHIDNLIIKLLFIIISTTLLNKLLKNKDMIIVLLSIVVFIEQLITNNIIFYLEELILINLMIIISNILRSGLINKVLTEKYTVKTLKEGMIPAYNLYRKSGKYYFDKTTLREKITQLNQNDNEELIISKKACGFTKEDIGLLNNLVNDNMINDEIYVKQALPFAPFILSGLIVTLIIGNTPQLLVMLMEMI